MISGRRGKASVDGTDGEGAVAVRLRRSPGRVTAVVGIVLVLLVAFISFLVWEGESFGSTDGGHVAIVRNGGPFDNTKIRQVLPASSGRTNIGMYSALHDYPTSQRFYTISSSGSKADANESITVPTADGVNVGIEGSAYFTLNTDPSRGYSVLKDFDNKYGTRKFRCTDSESRNIYDGDDGFSCFLDQVVAPVINNDLRVEIGDVKCSDLVASCSLVQNTTTAVQVDPTKVGKGNVNLAKIETNISQSLASDLNTTLGGPFFANVRFNLAKIDLDPAVQKAISDAQAKFAQVSAAQADLKQAQIQAQTNEARQQGYNACKACQQIDILKALPQKLTTLVLGTGSGVSLSVPAK
jgi:hypothetical protein